MKIIFKWNIKFIYIFVVVVFFTSVVQRSVKQEEK